MQSLAIITLSVMAAIAYGVIHDQVTARICVEYFTIGHPQVLSVPTDDPTILACVWGVLATWWVGVGLGIPLAIAARAGARPKQTVGALIRPMALLLLGNAIFATLAGLIGYRAASRGWIQLFGDLADRVPPNKHVPFLVDLWAHNASYLGGLIGGIMVMIWTYHSRRASELPR